MKLALKDCARRMAVAEEEAAMSEEAVTVVARLLRPELMQAENAVLAAEVVHGGGNPMEPASGRKATSDWTEGDE